MRPSMNRLPEVLSAAGEFAAALQAVALPALELTPSPTTDDAIRSRQSKFGGEPDMPKGQEWPTSPEGPLNFLAQINLSDVHGSGVESPLPREGLLLFFYRYSDGPWGFDPKDRDGFAVMYVPAGTPVERHKAPLKVDADDVDFVFSPCSLQFTAVASLPDPFAIPHYTEADVEEDAWTEFIEEHEDLAETLWGEQGEDDTCLNQMFGRPFTVQSPAIQAEAAAVTRGVYFGDAEIAPEHEALLAEAEKEQDDWIILLQLDTDPRPEWMWGDMGVLFFLVHKDAAAKGDFSNVWCILQCG